MRSRPQPERVEHASITFTIDGKAWETEAVRKHAQAFANVFGLRDRHPRGAQDKWHLTYNMNIEYRNVVKNLEAVVGLLGCEEVLADVELWEASGGSLLIVDLIDSLRATQQAIAERQKP